MCKHIVLCGNSEEQIKNIFLSVFPDAVFENIPDLSKFLMNLQQKCDLLINLLSRARESKLFENEQRFRLLFENTPIAYQSLNSDRQIIDVNPAWEEMTGYSKAEVLGKRMSEFMPKEQIPFMKKRFQELIEEGQICSMEFKLITKSKKIIVVSLEGKTVTDNKGIFIQTQCILQNITEKRKQEDALREREIKFRTLAENVPGTIFVCELNKTCTMLYLNDQAEVLTGYPKSYLLKKGNDFSKHIHKEDRKRVYNEISASVEKRKNYVIQYRILHRNGSIRWVEEMGTGIFPDGTLLHLQGFILDITERKETRDDLIKAKEKAEESNNLKTAFMNNLSHEVRTPLNAIVGFSSFLKADALAPEKRQYYADLVIKSSEQLLSIINDIIIISTIKTGQIRLLKKDCNLNSLLRDIYKQVSRSIDNPHLSLTLKTSDEDMTVFTDKSKLTQIITNLLNNAIKFTPHGNIEFGYTKKKDMIEFYVSDTGIGIKKEHQDMIFEPFRQGEISLDRTYGGTGLGLSIAGSFVDLLGGDIRVQSKEEKGSVFYFTIPIKQT